MAISAEDNEKRSAPPLGEDGGGAGEEEYEIEVKFEGPVTAKAWLVTDNMSGKEVWAPKSQCRIVRERDEDGNVLLACSAWWIKRAGLIV